MVKNEFLQSTKALLQAQVQNAAEVILDDVNVFTSNSLPLLIVKQGDDDITHASGGAWGHNLGVSVEIITLAKAQNDELLQKSLEALENLKGIKNIESVQAKKDVMGNDEVFSQEIFLKLNYFTPSFRI